ncbi:hypothetical protein PY650_35790, partial [Rhizobium calliandrae]
IHIFTHRIPSMIHAENERFPILALRGMAYALTLQGSRMGIFAVACPDFNRRPDMGKYRQFLAISPRLAAS